MAYECSLGLLHRHFLSLNNNKFQTVLHHLKSIPAKRCESVHYFHLCYTEMNSQLPSIWPNDRVKTPST